MTPLISDESHTVDENFRAPSEVVDRVTAFFQCPSCKGSESSTCEHFQINDLDTKQRYRFCKKLNPVKLWECSCNVKWHLCSKHRYARLGVKRPRMQVNTARGQAASNDDVADSRKKARIRHPTVEDIINDDLRSYAKRNRKDVESGESTINLGTTVHHTAKSHLLGPALKKRLMGKE